MHLSVSAQRGGNVRLQREREMTRREFITLLGTVAAWPLAARAQPLSRSQFDPLKRSRKNCGSTNGRDTVIAGTFQSTHSAIKLLAGDSTSSLAAADFLISAVVPAVHRVFEALDVALAVEGDWPEHGLVCTFV
jgi:hypothetical protein